MENGNGNFELEWRSNGRGNPIIQVFQDRQLILVDKVDLASEKDRLRFATRLHALADVPPAVGSRKLLEMTGDYLRAKEEEEKRKQDLLTPASGVIISRKARVRPELFFTPEVCGLAVPLTLQNHERTYSVWRLYLQWADGKREWRDLPGFLDLPDGRRLWFSPDPGPPPTEKATGWSEESQEAWLGGSPPPARAAVFQEVCRFISTYLDFPVKEDALGLISTMALFVFLTYCYPAFRAVPYLSFTGPAGSAKTRALEILESLVFRPTLTANHSPALLFRSLHAYGGTFLLDEAEKLSNTKDSVANEILSVLHAGYKQGGTAGRLEPVGDTYQPVYFDVYGPKAIASITAPPPTLASRCIPFPMLRAEAKSEKPKRLIDEEKAQAIRDSLHSWALGYGQEIGKLPKMDVCPPEVFGRNRELWQPLLALASWTESAGADGLLELLQAHAKKTVTEKRTENIPASDTVLLKALARLLCEGRQPTAGEVLMAAREIEPFLFEKWSSTGVGVHLTRYGVKTRKSNGRWIFDSSCLEDLQRVERTYGVELDLDQEYLWQGRTTTFGGKDGVW